MPVLVRGLDADVMIAGGMGPRAIDRFADFGIEAVIGAAGIVRRVVEACVLRLRFGFHGAEERTLREIAACLRLSRDRIRPIERQAMERLRRRTGAASH